MTSGVGFFGFPNPVAAPGYRPKIQIFVSAGGAAQTYRKSADALWIRVIVVGAGGAANGNGGSSATTFTNGTTLITGSSGGNVGAASSTHGNGGVPTGGQVNITGGVGPDIVGGNGGTSWIGNLGQGASNAASAGGGGGGVAMSVWPADQVADVCAIALAVSGPQNGAVYIEEYFSPP